MDVHVHNSRAVHYGRNNCHQNRHSEDEDLQFLSLEERECILFFEETIGSLEDELEDEDTGTSHHTPADEHPLSNSSASVTARPPSPVDHDIIDLVHSTPDPGKYTDTLPLMPDFQELAVAPETHFEMKAKRDPLVNYPDKLHISVPEEGEYQPPPGSVPTPVIIASKIAEHQGAGGASASPSLLLQRRRSLESQQNPLAKQGPPTHAKPTRLPDNISMLLGSREHIPHSIAEEAVSVQERRAQMLSNLTGSAHPLDGGEPACIRNIPMRSVSFRDPTPDKSRMEALSKLGLTRGRTQSVGHPTPRDTQSSSVQTCTNTALKNDYTLTPATSAPTANTSSNVHASNITATPTITKASTFNIASTDNIVAESYDTTDSCQPNRTTVTPSSPTGQTISKQDNKPGDSPALKSAEVTHSDFNSYGGKSITLNPMMSFRAEYIPPQNAIATSPTKPEPQEAQLNNFGGWSRVMTPSVVHKDEPNHGSSGHSPSNASHISILNSHGARSKVFPPLKEDISDVRWHPGGRTANEDAPTKKVTPVHSEPLSQPTGTRPAPQPPTPAPRPPRHSNPLSPTKPRPTPPSPEFRRKSTSKPAFRTQGITVQFSGRGATDEARRDALRKLGLLRDTS